MAEESILEKAIGFIPGVGKPKHSKKPATTQMQLVTLKRNLAKLLKDVEKLSELIGSGKKKPAGRPAASANRSKAGRQPARAHAKSATARTTKSAKARA